MTLTPNGHARDWWARTAVGLGGILAGMTVAWFTAYTTRGVTRTEMEIYVEKNSPYVRDKPIMEEHDHDLAERLTKLETMKAHDPWTGTDMYRWAVKVQQANKTTLNIPEPKHEE